MKAPRPALWLPTVFALIAMLEGTLVPARADATSFTEQYKDWNAWRLAFENQLQSLPSNGTTPGGLKAWANGVDSTADVLVHKVRPLMSNITYEGQDYKGPLPCGAEQSQLTGPYNSGFGFERLSGDITADLRSWEATMAKLDERQNDLNHAILAGRQYDKNFSNSDWSAALTSALKTAHNSYPTLAFFSPLVSNLVKTLGATLAGPNCQHAKQPPAPAATPSPTPPPKSKAGCVGFIGVWMNETFANPLYIQSVGATQERATSIWTFTGTVAGKVMSGTYASTRGDKGTFTFTMAYSDPDYIDVVTKTSYGTSGGLLTFHCARGL